MDPEDSGSTPARPADGGLTRRSVLAGAGGLAGAAAVAPAAQAASPRRVGLPDPGRAAVEVVGQVLQDGFSLAGRGYLTRLSGIRDDDMFRGDEETEAGARFTFAAEAQVRDRFIRGSLFTVVATGTVSFYLDDDGADFGAPASFEDGRRIASFRARFQNVLTVVAPDQAVTTIEGELVQRAAPRFRFDGRPHRYGGRGLRTRLSVAGPGTRTDPVVPRAVFEVAGRMDAVR